MSERLAIFIDDYACCAQAGPAVSQTAPTIALSSQVLMPKPDTGKPGALVCDLMHDPGLLKERLIADLSSDYERIGLAEALEPAAPKNRLEHYLTALIAACLRVVDAAGRIQEMIVAIPLRSSEHRPENPPDEKAVAIDDRKRVQSALNALAPLFEKKRFVLADAHDLAVKAAAPQFNAHLQASNAAVIGLWRERFSILHLAAGNNGQIDVRTYGAATFPIVETPIIDVSNVTIGAPIAKSLSPTNHTRLDYIADQFRLIPPQMPLDEPNLYGNLHIQLSGVFRQRYPATPPFATEVLNNPAVVQVGSYALIGSLAMNPAILAGTVGRTDSPSLSHILKNELDSVNCLSVPPAENAPADTPYIHPVMSVLDQAVKLDIGAAAPAETDTSPKVTALEGKSTEERAAGIQPVKISSILTAFTVETTGGKNTVAEIIALPSDVGYEVIVEYGHRADGAITLKAGLDKRVLPLKPADSESHAELELLPDGGYRLTLDGAHREACKLRSGLRRFITQGLRLHGSFGKENEEAF